jgi:hypothetical protein
MCRTIHCLMRMQGHGKQINSLDDLFSMLGQSLSQQDKEQEEETQESWLARLGERLETQIRASEIGQTILRRTPPEGGQLVGLDIMAPVTPTRHGVLTIATYALPRGAFRVVGTDHLTQFSLSHDTPNQRGMSGLMEATMHELAEQSDQKAEADDATKH